eukprot:TRINITY_DN1385_c0_g1_i1.p2 TRINITY_DN1385_c0_g1~~TRINITY_DN1385_c0_g1_i1.p2  ORF type:complete len:877 (+),score=144.68 TRINITY_DN1385_c0_g1_i1:82-2712(+)
MVHKPCQWRGQYNNFLWNKTQMSSTKPEEEKKETKKLSKGILTLQAQFVIGQKKKAQQKKKKDAPEGTSTLAKLAAARAAKHKEEEERKRLEEEKRKAEEELERQRILEQKRKEEEERQKRIMELKTKYQEEKKLGLHLTEKQKKEREKQEMMRKEMLERIAKQQQENGEAPTEEVPQAEERKKGHAVSSKRNKKKRKVTDNNKEAKKEEVEAEVKTEVKKEKDTAEEVKKEEDQDVDWEDLLKNPDKIENIVRPKLSVDEIEETAEKPQEPVPAKEEIPKAKAAAEEVKPVKEKRTEKKPVEEKPLDVKPAEVKPKRTKPISEEEKKRPELRAPILCVLGHVDTGKTKLLDKIRKTKVQEGEVGGITQQIGATFFPRETLEEHAENVKDIIDLDMKIPGLMIIDTPGHESFSNLRNRGSTLCDFAILVVDIMHGLENQTIESINILKKRNIPFVVALNKIDRCYSWKSIEYSSSKKSYERNEQCRQQFTTLTNKTIAQFAEQEINACLYWNNDDPETFVSLVPTSAITGEGIPDIFTYVVKRIQETLGKRIVYQPRLVCTVMEVKVVEGYGVTCDIILVTGELSVNDTVVLSGFEGPIVTTVRALLTPQPLKEMRIKGEYIHHESVRGTMGVKLCGPGLESALAGSPVYKARNEEEVEEMKKAAGEELSLMIKKYLSKTGEGVYVQSSTLGSLEALLELLKVAKVPVSSIGLGPIYKRHILKVLKASEKKGEKEEYATILAFEVEPDKEARELAEKNGIKVFTANVVYHLVDSYKKHAEECLYPLIDFITQQQAKKEGRERKGSRIPCSYQDCRFQRHFQLQGPYCHWCQCLGRCTSSWHPTLCSRQRCIQLSLQSNHRISQQGMWKVWKSVIKQ